MNNVVVIVAGCLSGCLAGCLPGLHAYNLMGLALLALHAGGGLTSDANGMGYAIAAMVTGYATCNTIPSVLLAAPDESAMFTVLPGQKRYRDGRGLEAIMLTAAGSAAALLVVLPFVAWSIPRLLPAVRVVITPHQHWLVWAVTFYLLMSEWPRRLDVSPGGHARMLRAWRGPAAGWLCFGLSAFLGLIVFHRAPLDISRSFQSLMPAFVGLFTLPWLVFNLLLGEAETVPQHRDWRTPSAKDVFNGTAAGVLGGGGAALLPAITGGVGGFLAGQALGHRNENRFLIAQGACKTTYYTGALLLFFIPGAGLTRGGAAWMLSGLLQPEGADMLYRYLAVVAIAAALALLALHPLSLTMIALIHRVGYRRLTALVLAMALLLVHTLAGWPGLFMALTGLGIGSIPLAFGTRRMHCLGIILVPVACNLSGISPRVLAWIGV